MTGWAFKLHFIDINSSRGPAVPCSCWKWALYICKPMQRVQLVWDVTLFSV